MKLLWFSFFLSTSVMATRLPWLDSTASSTHRRGTRFLRGLSEPASWKVYSLWRLMILIKKRNEYNLDICFSYLLLHPLLSFFRFKPFSPPVNLLLFKPRDLSSKELQKAAQICYFPILQEGFVITYLKWKNNLPVQNPFTAITNLKGKIRQSFNNNYKYALWEWKLKILFVSAVMKTKTGSVFRIIRNDDFRKFLLEKYTQYIMVSSLGKTNLIQILMALSEILITSEISW